ncbi:MAG: hypothetical protein IJD41_03200 [Alphaproteobacteria bacterium]|nr:hypothetical protein [Alphaproteobacteria bacterium]
MRKAFIVTMLFLSNIAYAGPELTAAIENVRDVCGNIGAELTEMKKMAGITTAVTAVGTVAGGVGLGAGIAKAKTDKELSQTEQIVAELKAAGATQVTSLEMFYETFADALGETGTLNGQAYAAQLREKKDKLMQKSKNLGNLRTGTLAAATATNIAGAIMSGTNRVKGDLKSQIDECLASIKTLSDVRMQARIDGGATDADLLRAENIIRECDAWSTVDITPINNRSKGATVSSGIGAGLGLVGTITSASANSDGVRNGDDRQKEKDLNTAANVLAGGTTVASATATIFNATQINAIKRAATVADQCEGALR